MTALKPPAKFTPQTQLAVELSGPKRMSLGAVIKGRIAQPLRIVVYGVEGIGKSSFAAGAPSPIFLGAEDGTAQLDVARFPSPQNWQDVLEAVRELETAEHDYGTLVIDTLDWLEPILWAHIVARDKETNIESYGYGKGYSAAFDEWRVFLAALERMRKARPMNVVMIAHSWIKSFKNPGGDDFDRYEMKLNAKASGLLKEWADCVLFANYETFANRDEKTRRAKGVDTGARLLYTQRRASYDAKNRHSLPEEMPLDWAEFSAAVDAHEKRVVDPELEARVLAKIEQLQKDTLRNNGLGALKRAGGHPDKLAQLNNWATAKLAEQGA